MLFLLALPVISCVALLWRNLQIYAPSNMLIRRVRSTPQRARTVPTLLALAAALLVAMHIVSEAVGCGAARWLNLVVLILGWGAIKVGWVGIEVAIRVLAGVCRRATTRKQPRPPSLRPPPEREARCPAQLLERGQLHPSSSFPELADPARVIACSRHMSDRAGSRQDRSPQRPGVAGRALHDSYELWERD